MLPAVLEVIAQMVLRHAVLERDWSGLEEQVRRAKDTHLSAKLGTTMWAFSDYSEGGRLAVGVRASLELAALLGGHYDSS